MHQKLFRLLLWVSLTIPVLASANEKTSKPKTTPDINIDIMGHDLVQRSDVKGDEYFFGT
ncbi:MAG: hypothetical protein M9899_08120 [Bdellovibrionaceae bacterium]|nr:hypothetical protein [Pseudobdellovibrionaceae bacterium]